MSPGGTEASTALTHERPSEVGAMFDAHSTDKNPRPGASW